MALGEAAHSSVLRGEDTKWGIWESQSTPKPPPKAPKPLPHKTVIWSKKGEETENMEIFLDHSEFLKPACSNVQTDREPSASAPGGSLTVLFVVRMEGRHPGPADEAIVWFLKALRVLMDPHG